MNKIRKGKDQDQEHGLVCLINRQLILVQVALDCGRLTEIIQSIDGMALPDGRENLASAKESPLMEKEIHTVCLQKIQFTNGIDR